MAILPLNLELQDAQGNALSGANVYLCTQPADTSTTPPSPLANVYLDSDGTPGTNPVVTDGFGKAQPYVSTAQMPFTVVYDHPLFLEPLVVVDQYPPGSSSGSSVTPVEASSEAGTIAGAINGTNTVFTLPSTPLPGSLIWQYNGQTLTKDLGYTITGSTVTMATAPVEGDSLAANYLT